MKPFALTPAVAACAIFAAGQSAHGALHQVADIADLSLEQLTQITVTTASRREERLIEAPASIFVISADDIRRSGATSLPEVLRLAPNVTVARADANQYAISARGYNNVLANKLLVLVDGRTVYTPLFSGVFWEAQGVVLEDIERIEVISGPAATLWGSNGVNGVINIITLPSSRTQGPLAKLAGGDRERASLMRFGDRVGAASYRIYAKYTERDGFEREDGSAVGDDGHTVRGGFRADWVQYRTQATLQGEAYRGDVHAAPERHFSGWHLLGRWLSDLGGGSSLRVQAYYDRTDRRHESTFEEDLDLYDIDVQHSVSPLAGHHLVWGGGYRHADDRVGNSAAQAFIPAQRSMDWANVYAQDEYGVHPGTTITAGIKAERNPYTGIEWLPNLRLAHQALAHQLVWLALSRAVRAPSRLDRDIFFPGQPPFAVVGSDLFEAEVAYVAELGYRAQVSAATSFSATLFHHRYPNLRSLRPTTAGPAFANDIEGRTTGLEGWGSYRISNRWRLSGGFAFQHIERNVKAGAVDLGGLASLGNDPNRKLLLRSSWDIAPDQELDVALRHFGRLPNPAVPAYTSLDLRYAWRPRRDLEVSLTAQNLLDRDHVEWGAAPSRAVIEPSYFVRLVWKP